MATYLILGGSGFVGGAIAEALVAAGHTIIALSRSEKSDAKLRAIGATPVRGDATSLDIVREQARRSDGVVSAVTWDARYDDALVMTLIDALAGSGKPFVYTCGTAVVATLSKGELVDDVFAEDTPYTPSPALSQRAALEQRVLASPSEKGVRAMVVRPPMVIGYGRSGQIGIFHEIGQRFGKVLYVGSGTARWCYVHIDDLAQLFVLALEKGRPGGLYHAVAGETDWRSIAEAMAEADGLQAASWSIEEADAALGKSVSRIIVSSNSRTTSAKTEAELGWAPSPDRRDIVSYIQSGAYRTFSADGLQLTASTPAPS